MNKKQMYELKKRKNVKDKVISDFGELLDHIESEQERLLNSSNPGRVEILDIDSGKTVMLTLPYDGDIVSYLEKAFNMQEISDEEQHIWNEFTEGDNSDDTQSGTGIKIDDEEEKASTQSLIAESNSEKNMFEVAASADIERFGSLIRKIVDKDGEGAEQLRQQLLAQILDKETGLVKEKLDGLQTQLDQKQKIYEKLMQTVKTSSDIDEVIIIANELVELQLSYDKVAARRG